MSILIAKRVTAAANEASDWLARSTGGNVIVNHNFDRQQEVDNYRYYGGAFGGLGTTPNIASTDGNCRWISNDGFAGGGCLECNVPTGDTCDSDWRRPFSPLLTPGNGKLTNDPAKNNTLTLRTYNPNNTGEYDWTQDWHGNAAYTGQAQFLYTGTFYVQFRTKISANRFNPANPLGKLCYIDAAPGENQEIVIQSVPGSGSTQRFSMYTNFGGGSNSFLTDPQLGSGDSGTGAHFQPGADYDLLCTYPGLASCWLWPADEWVTVVIAVTPGHHWNKVGSLATAIANPSLADTGIEVWVARYGATSYTKLWNKNNFVFTFSYKSSEGSLNAWNMVKFSGYMNGVDAVSGWTQRFTQLVVSHSLPPCPQFYA